MRRIIFLCCLKFSFFSAGAQSDIALGTWRLHLSYHNIQHVETSREKIFAATESGILVYDRQQRSLHTFNKLNGLGATGITSLKYTGENDRLLIGYESGDLDIISNNSVTSFDRLRDADVTMSKKINHISLHGDLAYLSTAYGVVLFDLNQFEVKETWRDLGVAGEPLHVYQTTFLNDSIFLATANGVLAGSLSDNLLDYNQWKRYNTGDFAGSIRNIISFNDKVYVSGPTGFFRFGNDVWVKEPFLPTSVVRSLTASSENLFAISDSTIWSLNTSGQFSENTDDRITAPAVVKQDEEGKLWVGDQTNGLLSNTDGAFSSYVPDGPSLPTARRMVYANGKIFALGGGISSSGEPLNIPGHLNVFEDGSWTASDKLIPDLTDIAFMDNKTFLSSFGSGLAIEDASGNQTIADETNSPLMHADGDKSNVTALAPSTEGLWVANYGGNRPVHLLKDDGSWVSLAFGYPNEQHPIDVAVDRNGDVWLVLNPDTGGGLLVIDRSGNQAHLKIDAAGSGALPHKNVRCITPDIDGYIWVGTDAGVAYFFGVAEDAIKPIYESRFLLRDEKITAIDVDAGNRKWIGTEHGVWLFNSTGESLVQHFTTENSPLLSDAILDIEIHSGSGEVFIATDHGIISYRSDAVAAAEEFADIKIFPNPVHPGYQGTVAISGLVNNAVVKITDISGKLIWQTQANGGMATWHVRNQEGTRPSTGVYLVFATSQDGTESIVGKVAVIE